ncbi:MAG: hypothetical protein M1835_000700 [Candelina submexicana]|nr:MAG: hypothetical protein M1835_000700 [Candelina submexicana]
MGVPHLAASLRPYATPIVFGKRTLSGHERAPDQVKVIDGPAFAHYIHHACLAGRPHAQGPLEATPSYREIGDEVIAWLDQVNQEMGLRFETFYFDGLLPMIKQPIRESRLEGYLKQLITYRKLTSKFVPNAPVSASNTEANLLVSRHAPSKLTALPAPPFLVPAVIEVLLEDLPYEADVRVVPGEADYYCARSKGRMIFTNDSDLLVYDLGDRGSVLFFNDLEEAVSDDKQPLLKGLMYQPRAIADRLGLRSIGDLAYEMRKRPAATFNEALARAKQHTDDIRDSRNYRMWQLDYQFGDKYEVPFRRTVRRHYRKNTKLRHALKRLDPRISECINQYGYDDTQEEDWHYVPIYLPFLIEDPNCATAWDTELPLRRLGYSLLHLALPQEERSDCIREYKRRGQIIGTEDVRFIKMMKAEWWCEILIATLEGLAFSVTVDSIERGITDIEFWKTFGIYQIVRWHQSNNRELPRRVALKMLVADQDSPTQSWSQLHLFARYQAVLYSARILQQFTEVAYQIDKGPWEILQFSDLLSKLHRLLEGMPSIEELFIAPKDLPSSDKELQIWDDIIRMVFDFCGIAEEDGGASVEKEDLPIPEKKKRKRTESQTNPAVQPLGVQSNNMFNILRLD